MKPRIGIVVQRFGPEILGGAELHCRQVALELEKWFRVEILTTCARGYERWDNHWTSGCEAEHGLVVRRFSVEQVRFKSIFDAVYQVLATDPHDIFLTDRVRNSLEHLWLRQGGPWAPDLKRYLEDHHERYAAVVFFSLYWTTAANLPIVANKSILIPTAHDDPSLKFGIFRKLFLESAAVFFNSPVEKKLVEGLDPEIVERDHPVVGVGIPPITESFDRPCSERYIVYLGRLDESKGVVELLTFFEKFRAATRSNLRLKLIGHGPLVISNSLPGVDLLGYLSEQDKLRWLKNSQALVTCSPYESLSLVALEAMSLGVPVVCWDKSAVVSDLVRRSGAGAVFSSQESFNQVMLEVESRGDLELSGAKQFVEENFSWPCVVSKYRSQIAEFMD